MSQPLAFFASKICVECFQQASILEHKHFGTQTTIWFCIREHSSGQQFRLMESPFLRSGVAAAAAALSLRPHQDHCGAHTPHTPVKNDEDKVKVKAEEDP